MKTHRVWWSALVLVLFVVAACGPEMATPTPRAVGEPAGGAPTPAPVAVASPTPVPPTPIPVNVGTLPVDPDDWHVLGPADAAVTVVEYSNYQCSFCARYAKETFPQIVKAYIETGKIRYVFKNYPASGFPQAQKAAETAECAGEQGQFWAMHDLLYGRQAEWSGNANAVRVFKSFAAELDLDQAQFDACLDGGRYEAPVRADMAEGMLAGVTGTPTFYINGAPLVGAQPFSAFQAQIEFYLAGGKPPSLEVAADAFNSKGRADAPVVVTEFSDFQCSACKQISQLVIPDLIERYVETGIVRYVSREFPIFAPKAAEAAVCAGYQDKYWEMHAKLFETMSEWSAGGANATALYKQYAQALGLNAAAFASCLDGGEATIAVQADRMAGEAFGVNATPYFFFNEIPIRGGLPIEQMAVLIDYLAAGGDTPEIVPSEPDIRVRGNLGQATAITVAFVDYASAESAQHALDVFPRLVSTYVNAGRFAYVLHPWATERSSASFQGALAAECAGSQGRYWEMHDQLFQDQRTWTAAAQPMATFAGYADKLGLDRAAFEACLDSSAAEVRVRSGAVVGTMYGVPGAPVFLFNNGTGQQGTPSFDEFKQVIDSIIGQ